MELARAPGKAGEGMEVSAERPQGPKADGRGRRPRAVAGRYLTARVKPWRGPSVPMI